MMKSNPKEMCKSMEQFVTIFHLSLAHNANRERSEFQQNLNTLLFSKEAKKGPKDTAPNVKKGSL